MMECIAANPNPTLGIMLVAGCACLAAIWLFGVYLPRKLH